MSDSNNSSGGIGILGLLGVLFIGLKLGKVITWSWWWVTVPFWGWVCIIVSSDFSMGIFQNSNRNMVIICLNL